MQLPSEETSVTGEALQFEVKRGVGTITLNRPEALNAANDQLYRELAAVIAKIAEYREGVAAFKEKRPANFQRVPEG
jgi:enoyl-CoA hydratase/carnithine racemase